MFYVTYVKQPNEPTPQQMSFDDFYATFFNNTAQLAPQWPLPRELVFRTIEVEVISPEYIQRFGPQSNHFISQWSAYLELFKNQRMNQHYDTFHIPKHSGGMREINAPQADLKGIMTQMLNLLQCDAVWPHNAAYAYVPKRCTKDAIVKHQKTNNDWFLKLDLHDFFGSCSPEFTLQQLQKIPFFAIMPIDFLRNFIHFISLNGGLPQGSPLSPYITNQIMVEFDYRIQRACHEHRITYTRYADDMLFSSTSRNAVSHAEEIVRNVLTGTPLEINTAKTRISSVYGQNWNLGIMLNKDHQITIGYKKKERLRATLHNFIVNRADWHYQECVELLGQIQYFHTIEPEYIDALLTKYGQKYNINVRNTIISIIKQGPTA